MSGTRAIEDVQRVSPSALCELVGSLESSQRAREGRQRDAAFGKRLTAIKHGQYGPVLRRWVNTTIAPTAARIRLAAEAYLNRDYSLFAASLDSPLFELSASVHGNTSSLAPLLAWCLRGTSPGRGADTSYCDDLVLAVIGTVLLQLCERQGTLTLTQALVSGASAARESAIGQWISTFQGAEALESTRRFNKEAWKQINRLQWTTGLMLSQVQQVLHDAAAGLVKLEHFGSRNILEIQTKQGKPRRLSIRTPEAEDWELLRLAFKPKGERDANREAWIAFALVVLCAAQMETGWFDLSASKLKGAHQRRAPHRLVFSQEAYRHIGKDIDRWLQLGFCNDPMLTKPIEGDYMTVKHNAVTGKAGPMGMRTEAEGSEHWKVACEVMAGTAWTVNEHLLGQFGTAKLHELCGAACDYDEMKVETILGAHRREAGHDIYLPIYMDFRGRFYPRTSFVTYQGNDLQKALLCFPKAGIPMDTPLVDSAHGIAIALHLSNLYGGYDKLDKAPLAERVAWLGEVEGVLRRTGSIPGMVATADEPLQFLGAVELLKAGEWNRIAVQMDGTCNGLQHLSAMFRDEQAAPYVNLTASTWEDRPSDIYQVVADKVLMRLEVMRSSPNHSWVGRLLKSNLVIDRKLTKKPVMVLPYGGTFGTIEEGLHESVLAQKLNPRMWRECLTMWGNDGAIRVDPAAVASGYLAFAERDLETHPLFKRDVHDLAVVVWECIQETIPKAVQAMGALRALGKHIKQDALTWDCNFGSPPLRVVHAYPKSASNTLKLRGLHLGGEVRALKINSGRDEVDPYKHVTGIVANFIHSQDATHLARTMQMFAASSFGKKSFGAVHDCFMCRPSDWESLRQVTREAFVAQYWPEGRHPLLCPVELQDIQTGTIRKFKSWLDMAQAFGVSFPDFGSFDPAQVLESAWFFS